MSSHIFSCVSVLQPSWLRLEYFHHRNDTSRKQPLTIPPFGPSNHSPAFVFAVCGTCCISRISRVPTSRLIFLEFPWCFLAPLWSCSVSFHHHHSCSRVLCPPSTSSLKPIQCQEANSLVRASGSQVGQPGPRWSLNHALHLLSVH